MPKAAIPTSEQLQWLDCEIGVIIHLDMQVFESGYHFRDQWGYTPSAKRFNPSALNTDQWLQSAQTAGAKYALFTAKHNSGFSFWPTRAHPYSVANSPWKNGKGDLVADFIDSCKKYGLHYGLYCSASANAYFRAEDPGRVVGGTPDDQKRYNENIMTQYSEIWGNYGPLFELWFDGGIVPAEEGGPAIHALRERLQPRALVLSGQFPVGTLNRLRYGGAEDGKLRLPSWGTVHADKIMPEGALDGDEYAPAEGIIANRCGDGGGWFWHEGDDATVHNPLRLLKAYYDCVGRNGNLLIGMVIDNRGLVPEPDIQAFREFGNLVRTINALPRDTTGGTGCHFEMPVRKNEWISEVLLAENLSNGERVRQYCVEALVDGNWQTVCKGEGIGHKRLIPVPAVRAERVRLRIPASMDMPEICEFSVYDNPVFGHPQIRRDRHGIITITTSGHGEVLYTLDGSEPTADSTRYIHPLQERNSGIIRACFIPAVPQPQLDLQLGKYWQSSLRYGWCDDEWEVLHADSELVWPDGSGRVDNKENVLHSGDWLWRSGLGVDFPHELTLDLKKPYEIGGFLIVTDNLCEYEFYTGDTPTEVKNLTFKGCLETVTPAKQYVRLPCTVTARYCRLRMLSSIYKYNWVVVRSLEITGA